MKAFLVLLLQKLKSWDGIDLLSNFLYGDSAADIGKNFLINNFSVGFLANTIGLIIIWLLITKFYMSIKEETLPLSLSAKLSVVPYRWSVFGITALQFLTLLVCLFTLFEVAAADSENPSNAEISLVIAYSLEWLMLLATLAVFAIFGGIWTASRFRDLGQSGWRILLTLVPVVNLYFMAILLFKNGNTPVEEPVALSKKAAPQKSVMAYVLSLFGRIPLLQKVMFVLTMIFIFGTGAIDYNIIRYRFNPERDFVVPSQQEEPVQSNGIFIGTANHNDFYLLPETFSGDEKNFNVTVEYIDKDENQKGTIGYFFVYNPVGWICYDSIDESQKHYVKKLKEGDVVKNIWQYCYENLVVKSPPPPEQNEPPKKKPMYRYPGQHENGRLVWAGYMNGLGCYLDINSIHVFDNTSDYKDWEQVVKLYDEGKPANSVTQNFHWDPQNGACVGGRGISKITDRNLMYQFETGWQYAFGYGYNR